MAVSLEQFVKQLENCGVLAADTIKDFIPPKASPKDAEALVRELVRQKKLTKFQAEEVWRGKGKSLVLGNYVLLEKIGAGGMGQVFKARHQRMDRMVAVKLLPAAMTKDKTAIARFEREVKAAARLRHSNIVGADDADCENGVHFLVMEYVEGSDLSALVKKNGRFPVGQAIHYILQAARGLEFAHGEGIVHRDIKPSNLLLDKKGTVKILDMGLARIHGDAGSQAELTATGAIMGTVDYMAPEQALNTKTADARADIYALGCSLFYLLTAKATFDGDTLMAKLLAHRDQAIPALRTARPEVPEPLEAAFEKMVAKKAEDRYQTMTEVIAALERCGGGQPIDTPQSFASPDTGLTNFLQDIRRPAVTSAVSKPVVHGGLALRSGLDTPVGRTANLEPRPSGSGERDARTPASPARNGNRHKQRLLIGGGAGALLLLAAIVFFVPAKKGSIRAEKEHQAEKLLGQGTLSAGWHGWHGWPADAPPPAIAPFDAVQAKKYQADWAKYLKLEVEYTNSIGMKFVLIPPGEFAMGSTPAEIEEALKHGNQSKLRQDGIRSEAPKHKVVLTQPIYLAVHEVTQADYEKVMGKNPSYFAPMGPGKIQVAEMVAARYPVESVSWNDAAEFCAKLSQYEKRKPFYSRTGETVTALDGAGYRLPTEAEWEFACRAGTTTKYWIGDKDDDLPQAGWFGTNSGKRTHAVGELRANPFGLYDVHGNVFEWVQDRWEPTFFGRSGSDPAVDPNGPSSAGSPHMVRGGHWDDSASECRTSLRLPNDPPFRGYRTGFRVSLVAGGGKPPPPANAPFDAKIAKQHQAAWAKHLNVEVEYTNSLGMKFVLIPPGEFTMGSTPAEIEAALKLAEGDKTPPEFIKGEGPQHKVILTKPIYLGVHEVTQKDYAAVMGANPSRFAATGPSKAAVAGLDTSNHPVETVSWNDAAEFCAKLSEREKLKPFYLRAGERVTPLDGAGYRLPTEAEWEFACRAGTTAKYWIGDKDDELAQAAWFVANSGTRTHAVGELKANPFGLYDVHGNVFEWVQDWWEPNSYGQFQTKPALDPGGPSSAGSQRVIRGGNYNLAASGCRASLRAARDPPIRYSKLGFRVSLVTDAVQQASK